MRGFLGLGLAGSLLAASAAAQPVRVATDIAAVHGLVSSVMEGVGAPDLVIPQTASPHGHSMRPSEARALASADLVIWIGSELTPWLEARLDALAGDAGRLTLTEVPGTVLLAFRDADDFDTAPAGGHQEEAGHGHATDVHSHHEHDAHEHGDKAAHGQSGDHGHDHAAGAADPHAWLDPHNARTWLGAIADALAGLDPENAATYQRNAEAAAAEISDLEAALRDRLAGEDDLPILVFHDAYAYFEARFGLRAAGAITWADGTDASAGQLAMVRRAVDESGAACIFAEPQARAGLIHAAAGDIKIVEADPNGASLPLGPGFYPGLLAHLGAAAEACLRR